MLLYAKCKRCTWSTLARCPAYTSLCTPRLCRARMTLLDCGNLFLVCSNVKKTSLPTAVSYVLYEPVSFRFNSAQGGGRQRDVTHSLCVSVSVHSRSSPTTNAFVHGTTIKGDRRLIASAGGPSLSGSLYRYILIAWHGRDRGAWPVPW